MNNKIKTNYYIQIQLSENDFVREYLTMYDEKINNDVWYFQKGDKLYFRFNDNGEIIFHREDGPVFQYNHRDFYWYFNDKLIFYCLNYDDDGNNSRVFLEAFIFRNNNTVIDENTKSFTFKNIYLLNKNILK